MNTETENSIDRVVTAYYTNIDLAATQLDHPEWTKVQPVPITRRWSGEGSPVSQHAEARILWSEESLVVRFVCSQHEPLIVNSNPQLTQKTIGLWARDVCEIFIAPDPNAPERYFEFEAAPTGEWVDLAIDFTPTGRETDFEFHSGMTAAAGVAEGQTIIALRIPWSVAIPKPQRGDEWRVNLFRCVGIGDERYLAWQPTHTVEPNFHVPEVFGWLRFA
jgi:cellulose/xylan binding protein with CBM9 domain